MCHPRALALSTIQRPTKPQTKQLTCRDTGANHLSDPHVVSGCCTEAKVCGMLNWIIEPASVCVCVFVCAYVRYARFPMIMPACVNVSVWGVYGFPLKCARVDAHMSTDEQMDRCLQMCKDVFPTRTQPHYRIIVYATKSVWHIYICKRHSYDLAFSVRVIVLYGKRLYSHCI